MKNNPVILLAEDDPNDEDLIRLALREADCECSLEVVHDGVEVIDYLFATGAYSQRDASRMPQLLLLDLKMPRMNGLQVLQVLRRVRLDDHTKLPPVVTLTSSNEEHDINEAYRWGAHSYIRKPVDFHEFSRAVNQIVNYWLGLNQPPRGRGKPELAAPHPS
jgi:two-component system response regulator